MDDYQKHLEKQLQQQHHQSRNPINDINAPRPLQQPLLHQQRIQPPPPQWTTNMVTGAPPTPGNPGFGRGLAGSPMGMNPVAQQAPQGMAQGQMNSFPSPQAHIQSLQNAAQGPRQKTQSSPAPGSPVMGDNSIYQGYRVY
jgi:hypothetical protein